MRQLALLLLWVGGLLAQAPSSITCTAGAPVGAFPLNVYAPKQDEGIPLRAVNRLREGYVVRYLPSEGRKISGELTLILVPAVPRPEGNFIVLPTKDMKDPADWTIPFDTKLFAVVYAPKGLDTGKVKALVKKDQQLIPQLAQYAERTTQAEQLVEALMQPRPQGATLDAAVRGFVASSGTQQINPNLPADRQYSQLISALNPALSAYDPLAGDSSRQLAQTASLAAVVSGLFFGPTVGLAAGSAALANNLRTLAFPNTEFRSAFAQPDPRQLTLCARREPAQSRTKLAYIWATKLPEGAPPSVDFARGGFAPVAKRVTVEVKADDRSWGLLNRVRNWALLPGGRQPRIPVNVTIARDRNALDIELPAGIKAGGYKLTGDWDWDPLLLETEAKLLEYPELGKSRVVPASQAQMVASAGKVPLQIEGPDFQFLDKLTWKRANDRFAQPQPLPFYLPKGKQGGVQMLLESEVDTRGVEPGEYTILLAQSNGTTAEIPARVYPEHPKLDGLPVMLAREPKQQRVMLRGSGLDRIESLRGDGLRFELGEPLQGGHQREAVITLERDFNEGAMANVEMLVAKVDVPVPLRGAVRFGAVRPVLSSVVPSLPADLPLEVSLGEVPADVFVNFALQVKNVATVPVVRVRCAEKGSTLQTLELKAGESRDTAKLQSGGPGQLFLSLDPGSVGPVGCTLVASIETASGGLMDRVTLGKVIRLPKIESFELTEEQVGDGVYVGLIKGQDLEVIEKTGWDGQSGLNVLEFPAPIAGEGRKQRLRVALRWPSPSPKAPVYVWLRGEEKGRKSRVRM